MKKETTDYKTVTVEAALGGTISTIDTKELDRFWGFCGGLGENYLGKLLMEIRGGLK